MKTTLRLKSDKGFTIIELLVVMAIIGLLAAIAIPVFTSLKNNAYDAAAQSDLRAAVIAIETVHSQPGNYPTGIADSELTDPSGLYKVKKSHPEERFIYNASETGNDFVSLQIKSKSGVWFIYIVSQGTVTKDPTPPAE